MCRNLPSVEIWVVISGNKDTMQRQESISKHRVTNEFNTVVVEKAGKT